MSLHLCPALGLLLVVLVPLPAAPPAHPADAAEGTTVENIPTTGSVPGESPAEHAARMQWWREAKFGLFIHWGVYAVPAGNYGDMDDHGEWIMHRARIPVAEYREFARRFNPRKYDPAAWIRLAQDAGMRYLVVTAKHHDGFALYPSAVSTWNVADATPYQQDLLGPLVTAARAAQLKIGFYYSQAQDWNNPGGAKNRFAEGEGWDEAQRGDFDTYLATIAAPQVRELLTRYQPDILWWDTPTWMNKKRVGPLAELVALRPGLITNNRLGPGYPGDTATPEGFVPATGIKGDWETCMTLNDHWGYNAADHHWKSPTELIRELVRICAKGGNYLLNVGPDAEGEIPAASGECLREIGRWLRSNGEAIYGTTAGPFAHLSWGTATRKAGRLFLHVFTWPRDGALRVPLHSAVKQAALLAVPGRALPLRREAGGGLVVQLPPAAPDTTDTVVVLELAAEPVAAPIPSLGKIARASSCAPGSDPANLLDGAVQKIWEAAGGDTKVWAEIDLGAPTTISGFAFDEPDVWPRLKQSYRLEAAVGDGWQTLAEGRTVGHGGTGDFASITAQRFRLVMERAAGAPALAEWQLYGPE